MLLTELLTLVPMAPSATDAPPTALEILKTWVEIFGTLVTAGAVIVAGLWAYFRFFKDRTYRPRLDVTIVGEWKTVEGVPLLHVNVSVKNIGTSVVTLIQRGTGLEFYPASPSQSAPPRLSASWDEGPVLSILTDHNWIEPGETVSDDLVARNLNSAKPLRLDVRLVWKWKRSAGNIVVKARKIVWPVGSDPNPTGKEKKSV
jgi:hypothetical protein